MNNSIYFVIGVFTGLVFMFFLFYFDLIFVVSLFVDSCLIVILNFFKFVRENEFK